MLASVDFCKYPRMKCMAKFCPRQHTEKLIPMFIQKAAAGEELPLCGDGSNVRECIYVADNCQALDLISRVGEIGDVYVALV